MEYIAAAQNADDQIKEGELLDILNVGAEDQGAGSRNGDSESQGTSDLLILELPLLLCELRRRTLICVADAVAVNSGELVTTNAPYACRGSSVGFEGEKVCDEGYGS